MHLKNQLSHLFMVHCAGQLTGSGVAPYRSHANDDGVAIVRVLPYIFMLDMTKDGEVTYRLAGGGIRSTLGFDPEGTRFYDIWNAQAEVPLRYYLRRSALHGKALCLNSTVNWHKGVVEFETTIVPVEPPDYRLTASFFCVTLARDDIADVEGEPLPKGHCLNDIGFIEDGTGVCEPDQSGYIGLWR